MDRKNSRVLVACNRCKVRKRKCDGGRPCSNCNKASSECEYGRNFQSGDQETINNLLDQIKDLTKINKELQHELEMSQVSKPNIIDDTVLSESTFSEIISRILYRNCDESEEYIGTFAVITIVKAIRNLLGNETSETVDNQKYAIIIEDSPSGEHSTDIPPKTEELFLEKYFSLAHNRCYLIDHVWFHEMLPKEQKTPWEKFCLNMALGIGCRLNQLLHVTTYPSPEHYFRRALKVLTSAKLDNMRQIQSCLLIAMFISRSYHISFYVSSWELTGMAIRKLIQYGYHRKQTVTLENCWQYEVQKRIFWSCYNNDKLLSLSLGRPFVYFDSFVDIPYPISMDISNNPTKSELYNLYQLQLQQEKDPLFTGPISCYTTFINTSKIRLIESRIHLLLYSVNGSIPVGDNFETINRDLERWYSELPLREDFDQVLEGRESYDFLELLYHRAKLILLIPIIMKTSINSRSTLLDQACLSAGRICISYKLLYKDSILEFSIVALHTVFLAGITLVFYLKNKGEPRFINIHNDIRACSSLLFVFSERWIEAKVYRDLFENLLDDSVNKNIDYITLTSTSMENNHGSFDINEDFWDQIMNNLGG